MTDLPDKITDFLVKAIDLICLDFSKTFATWQNFLGKLKKLGNCKLFKELTYGEIQQVVLKREVSS